MFNINYNDSGPLTLTESGTYYLLAVGASTSPLSYGFRLTDTAYEPITFGTTTSGTVTTATQSDIYSFTGTAGERTYFEELTDSNGSGGASWDLYGPQNQYITSASIGGDLTATLPSTGTYTLAVYNNTSYATATYSFEAFQNADPTSGLTLGTPVTGSIANPGDEATFTFTGSPSQRIDFNSLASPTYYVFAQLTDPNGNSIFNNSEQYNEGPYTLTYAGTYTLTVYSYGTTRGTGNYSFAVDDVTSPTASVALTAGAGTVVSGTLSGLSTNFYQLSGTAGERLYFQGISDSPGSAARYNLYNAANSNILNTYAEDDGTVTLPATGTYLLDVAGQSASNASVSYKFEVFENVDPTTGLTLGTPVSGTIANPGDEATYTFTGSPGQRIDFNSLASPTYYVFAQLTDPNGNSIFNNSEQYNEGPYTLTYAGTYTLTVYSYGTQRGTGNYSFAVDDVTSPTASVALTAGAGTVVSGTLSGLSTNFYQLSGTAGERLYFQGISDSVSNATRYNLYNATNGNILNNWAEDDGTVTLPATGTYLLDVAGQSASNASVNYKFEVFENVDPTTGLTLGTPASGTIANPGDEATYTFTGSPGQRIYVNGLASPTYYVFAQLTDPNGNSIFNNSEQYNEGPYTLTYAGTYTLTVYSYGTTRATGSYSFAVDDVTAPSASVALTAGSATTVSGTLAGLSTNFYQLSGTAGERLYFQGISDSVSDATRYNLYNAANGNILNNWAESDGTVTLPATGTYLLDVAGQSPATHRSTTSSRSSRTSTRRPG